MNRLVLILLGLLLAPTIARAADSEEEAGDVSEVDKDRTGPLRERVRPVSGHLFLKRHRFEFSPSATASMNDAFFTKYFAGLTLSYYPAETWALGLRLGYGFPLVSGAAQICTTQATATGTTRGCRPPTYDEVNGTAPGQTTLLAGVDLAWAPIYGKVALVSEKFLHFDLYGLVGPSLVGYKGPSASGVGSDQMMTVGGNVGLGGHFILNKWLAVRTELRDLVYPENTLPTGSSSLRNQLLFELGFSMFFPTVFTPE